MQPQHTLIESGGFLLWHVSNAWQRLMRNALAPTELTHVQFVLLHGLDALTAIQGSATQNELARHTKLDKMMVSKVLRVLEERQLITRDANVKDGRSVNLNITPTGRVLLEKASHIVLKQEAQFLRVVERKRDKLEKYLSALYAEADPE